MFKGKWVLYYPKGVHHIGLVELESHTTVLIDSGAVVYGSFIAFCAEDIKICGNGIIDGSWNRCLRECIA